MPNITYESSVPANPDRLFKTIVDVSSFPEYIRGIRDVKFDKPGTPDQFEVNVRVVIRYFSGWAIAKVQADPDARTILVDMVKGPLKLAKCNIKIGEGEDDAQSHFAIDVTYATPLAIYSSLIERHKTTLFDRLSSLFAARSNSAGSAR